MPNTCVKERTPEEAWHNSKPSVEYFKVFGCVGHVHISDKKRQKLDDRSLPCVFLGFSKESKAYRMYDPVSKKVIISRDVVFEEDKSWDWKQTNEGIHSSTLAWGDTHELNESLPSLDDCPAARQIADDSIDHQEEPSEGDFVNGSSAAATRHSSGGVSAEDADAGDASSPAAVTQNQQSSVQGRERRTPIWMRDYVSGAELEDEEEELANLMMCTASCDPMSFEEAAKSSKWREAMELEIKAIEKNETWELTTLPAGAKRIGVKWIFKTKLNENGEVSKHKARLVAKGYSQQYGIDYTEVFAPVARWDTIRMFLALAACKGWEVYQLDVKSAFLHGELQEAVFIEQPQGYEVKGEEDKVYKLKKAIYGLKQAPRAWYNKIESYFEKEGFNRCPHEHTLFTKREEGGKMLLVSIYVDDLIFTGNDETMFEIFKKSMKQEFDMSDLGKMKYFLGVEVLQNSKGIFINQKKYANEVLERFGMEHCNPVKNPVVPGCKLVKDEGGVVVDTTTYKQMVGSLMYMTATRPDLAYVVGLISRFMERPTDLHQQAVKRVLRYLKGTTDLGIFYKRGGGDELIAFSDSDYAGDIEDRKSTSGYVFLLSSGAVAWSSKKQPIVTLSTTEAEFVAASSCACQSVWMRGILEQLGHEQSKCTDMFCDNTSTIKLSKNPVMHGRSKHIDIRFHFLRDLTKTGIVKLEQCSSADQLADIMTKPLKLEVFTMLRELLGVCEAPSINCQQNLQVSLREGLLESSTKNDQVK